MNKIILILFSIISINTYSQVYIPNSFTPNSDGVNDYIRVYTLDTLSLFDFKIYNSYGELVFKTNDINEVWMGGDEYYNTNKQYVYILLWRKQGIGNIHIKQGYINLIR